jgi:hypothetical protein
LVWHWVVARRAAYDALAERLEEERGRYYVRLGGERVTLPGG